MDSVMIQNPVERAAMRYLEDQAYAALLGFKEPVRSAEILAAIGNEEYSPKLVRHVLAASPRFTQIDRRWDLEARYEDKQRPLERVLRQLVAEYGRPITIPQIANELSSVYDRPTEYYETLAERLLADSDRFFQMPDGLYGLCDWLLDVSSDDREDLIFNNELDEAEIDALRTVAAKVKWAADDVGASVAKFLKAAKTPVSNKTVGFFQWEALGEAFDPLSCFQATYETEGLLWLSDGCWASKSLAEEYDRILVDMAQQLAEEVIEEVPQAAPEKKKKKKSEEEAAPALSLTISERDLDEIAQIVAEKDRATSPMILETIFEISPREPIYAVAAEGLADAMKADPRFAWVGGDRWRLTQSIPEYAKTVPSGFEIPTLVFETPEGELVDVELEDEGLEGDLAKQIYNPLVQDVLDCEPPAEADSKGVESVECVVKAHHKQLGTFPLCQVPDSFLPAGPALIEMTLAAGEKSASAWANRETGLIYDMGEWYSDEMPESGAVFTLTKTDDSGAYSFVYEGKTDPLVFVNPSRMEELATLRDEAKDSMPMHDIMLRLMAYHKKGVEFVTLFTEVNIVRRTTRRLVASILSSYYAFYQRPKTSLWLIDEKKVDQGFKKAKKKYVRKEQ